MQMSFSIQPSAAPWFEAQRSDVTVTVCSALITAPYRPEQGDRKPTSLQAVCRGGLDANCQIQNHIRLLLQR